MAQQPRPNPTEAALLTRTSANASEAKARARKALSEQDRFSWPSPPYLDYIDDIAHAEAEECLLVLTDGTKSKGSLLHFEPDEARLRFLPANSAAMVTYGFAEVSVLQLLRPVRVRRQGLDAEEIHAASERQNFRVDVQDGTSFQGETAGSVSALCGLFVFPPEGESSVMRWFFPVTAMQSSAIGAPIGQMLIEERLASAEAVEAAVRKQQELRMQRLGDYLTESRIVSPEQLVAALKLQRAQPTLKLGESLIDLGILTRSQHEEALRRHARNREMPLGQVLAEMGVVSPDAVNAVMAAKLGIPVVNLRQFAISSDAIARLSAPTANRFQVVPLFVSDGALVIAMENPLSMGALEQLRFATDMKVLPVMASREDLRYAIDLHYGVGNAAAPPPASRRSVPDLGINELASRLLAETVDVDLKEDQLIQMDSTLVKLVNKMILDAVSQKASDVHLESNPGAKATRIRFRKDGMLVDYLYIPSRFRNAVVSRLKIMSQLDITEHRKPQDGKIDFSRFGPERVELRVTTIPTRDGLEDMVMRVLAASEPVPIDQLGFDEHTLGMMRRLISKPLGLFLVCGPTGSGKTTTLHSLLGFLNTDDRKIWTAEDPIEITQPGLRQVQVNAKLGWSFAAAMRSFLRADPDVIMIGEMRDAETAKIGIEASLTGHLVLSTLHTNSAPECIVRLLDLGMDPFNFADAVLGILAQRLIRRLCPSCRVAYVPTRQQVEELLSEYCNDTSADAGATMKGWRERYQIERNMKLWRSTGCEHCDNSGYKGRLGLYELLVADPAVKRLVQSRGSVSDIRTAGILGGMRTLKQDGIEKVLQGLTDIHQVRAACG